MLILEKKSLGKGQFGRRKKSEKTGNVRIT
jgi:hypothetical protein